jgi:hypothetical protein
VSGERDELATWLGPSQLALFNRCRPTDDA